jgi:hypothetical protein
MVKVTAVRLLVGFAAALLLAGCGTGGPASSQLTLSPVAAPPPNGATAVAYTAFTFVAPTGGVGPFRWTETGALPPGMSLSAGGTLSGTPTAAGAFPFKVTVTDTSTPNLTATESVTLLIIDSPLVISTTPTPPPATVTHPYAGFEFTASGGSAPLTWKVSAGQLPPGLTLGSDGSLSGTPSTAGPFTFTVAVTDSAPTPETKSQAFTLRVNNPPPPVINPTPTPPVGTACAAYPGFSFTATGGFLPLSWGITPGALPPGLSLGTDGAITGIPTLGGSFPVTVTVTDSAATPAMNSSLFTIIITTPPPTINNTQPPTGTVGIIYPAFTFTACGGLAPLVWSETGTLPSGLGISVNGVLSGTPLSHGIFPITVYVKDALNQSSPTTPFTVRVSLARVAAAFTPTTGSMTVARAAHTATLLQNGQVLIAGGNGASSSLASAELYDPTSQAFTATGSMTTARSGHTATLLANATLPNHGKILVAGGGSQTAELYDPMVGTFTTTGGMIAPHTGQTATLLQNGRVLVAGGGTASAELFNPSTGTFTATGSMTVSRTGQTATLLLDGRVLIAGGGTATDPAVASAELYDPVSGTFTATGSMSEGHSGHTATLLLDGTVLVAGPDNTAELFSPGTGTFSVVGELLTPGSGATATLRNDSTVLVAGGRIVTFSGSHHQYRAENSIAAAELFATESEGFTATGSLRTPRDGHTATLLVDGTVLVAGGVTYSNNCHLGGCYTMTLVLSSAELFK